jgi:hypothetical protein
VKGVDGRSAEAPTHLPEGVILCHLEDGDEGLVGPVVWVPGRDPICQDGDDNGLEQVAPRHQMEATNGVAKQGEGLDGRLAPGGEGVDVRLPGKLWVKEQSEVSDVLGDLDLDGSGKQVMVSDMGGGGPQEGEVGAGGEEHHGLGLVGVSFQTLAESQ